MSHEESLTMFGHKGSGVSGAHWRGLYSGSLVPLLNSSKFNSSLMKMPYKAQSTPLEGVGSSERLVSFPEYQPKPNRIMTQVFTTLQAMASTIVSGPGLIDNSWRAQTS